MLLALVLLPLPDQVDRPAMALLAIALSALIVLSVRFVPWRRLPPYAEAVPPLAYFLVIALLRESQPGATSGYSALAMLPVFWLALYGTRGQLAIGIAGLASTFLAPMFLDASEYPATEWRPALLWICAAPIVGFTVQALVTRLRERVEDAARSTDETRRLLAYMAAVTAVTRKLAGSSDSDAVREEICSAARAITGADFALLIEPDADGSLELVAWVGEPLRYDAEDAAAAERVYVTKSGRFAEQRGLHFEPVLRDDVAAGVLVVGWQRPLDGLGEAAQSGLRMLAAEAAIAIDRAELLGRLEESARTDDVLGLPNRRAWERELPRELARATRDGSGVCVAMLDVDHFKRFNDARGHQAGDLLLRQTVAAWAEQVRASDMLARYGGDEFALLLPGCTLADAETLVQRLRVVTPEGQTVSAGLACWDGRESPEHLVGRADSALYAAKRGGRDRLIAA
jgi:diguanylate cyclase (GGDEF)-like protein